MTKLNKRTIQTLFKRIITDNDRAFGEYEFYGMRISVRKPVAQLNRERSRRLYERRREQGLCVHCGVKVRSRNPYTDRIYRYCDFHRQQELDRKKQSRKRSRQY